MLNYLKTLFTNFGKMTQEQLKLFYLLLEKKNSWGKNEIKKLLLEITSNIITKEEDYSN